MSIPRNLSKIADNIDSNGVLTASGGGLPSQTSQSGKYLTTDGTNSSWATVAVGGGPIIQNETSVSTSQVIASGSNGQSFGPITVNTGATVTVATGQKWIIFNY